MGAAIFSSPDNQDDLPRDCTFEPEDWRILAKHWYPVALSRDLYAPNTPHRRC